MDSTRSAKSTLYQGIAFWVNGRLVGAPGWIVGAEAVIDGRARFAKRYSIVVKTDDNWMAEVEPDWSCFKAGPKTNALFDAVRRYAQRVFSSLSSTLVEESSEEALVRNKEQFKEPSQLGRAEVATFARELAKSMPTASQDVLSGSPVPADRLGRPLPAWPHRHRLAQGGLSLLSMPRCTTGN